MNRKETYIRNITNRTINDLLYGRIEKFCMPRNKRLFYSSATFIVVVVFTSVILALLLYWRVAWEG